VDRNLKAELNYNFDEINLTLKDSTMDLLKSLLKKDPEQRISASKALKHPAFDNVSDVVEENENVGDDQETDDGFEGDNQNMYNLRNFHEK
jgi:serine/threonine protein kinase